MRKTGFAVAVAAAIAGIGMATPAHAVDANWRFTNQDNGRCLTSDANGYVYTLTCSTNFHQGWIERSGDRRANRATQRCLSRVAGIVRTSPCADKVEQAWTQESLGDGYYQIRAKGTGSCLDSGAAVHGNGAAHKVYLSPCGTADRGIRWSAKRVFGG